MPFTAEFLSVPEAAKIIGVTVGRVRQMLIDGKMRGYKLNQRAWMVPRSEVERLRERQPGTVGRPRSENKSAASA